MEDEVVLFGQIGMLYCEGLVSLISGPQKGKLCRKKKQNAFSAIFRRKELLSKMAFVSQA
jgi:hypothetical protein